MTKLSPRGLVLAALAALALVAGVTACSTGTLGVTNFDSLTLSDDLVVGDDATVGDDLTVTGSLATTGGLTGPVDLNGGDLTVDADADTILDEAADDNIRLTSGAATGLWNVLTGNLKVGNGTPTSTLAGEDAYIEGSVEADGGFIGAANVQNLFVPTYATAAFTYTSAAGGTLEPFTVPAGQVWWVHGVGAEVTEDFVAAGDDEGVLIGIDGQLSLFCEIPHARLLTTYTGVGAEGWACPHDDDARRPAVLEAAQTIVVTINEDTGTTLSAGAATVHLLYTRIQ